MGCKSSVIGKEGVDRFLGGNRHHQFGKRIDIAWLDVPGRTTSVLFAPLSKAKHCHFNILVDDNPPCSS
jgi:hypothetical protein